MPENFDEKKVERTIKKLHKTINDAGLNIQEILVAYGNLGYHLGASMAGFADKGPDIETIKKEYYSNPTVDTGLMLQGLLMTTWEKDFTAKPNLSRFLEYNKKLASGEIK